MKAFVWLSMAVMASGLKELIILPATLTAALAALEMLFQSGLEGAAMIMRMVRGLMTAGLWSR